MQGVELTKLRVAVKRLWREVTTVPLRLRPICLWFSPSSGPTPKRGSHDFIGCEETKCLSNASEWLKSKRSEELFSYLVEVGRGAVFPVHTPLHVCIGGFRASLPPHSENEPL